MRIDGAVADAPADSPADAPVDADPAIPGTITLTATAPAAESGTITVTASRTLGSGGAISVDYTTVAGTATAADFTAATGTLAWADGDMADKTFTVAILPDLLIEGNEMLTIQLSNATGGATLGAAISATIVDDDRVGDTSVLTSTNRLLSFDRGTPGTITSAMAVTGLPAVGTIVGIDVRPASGAIYALTSTGVLYTIDRTTGVATMGAALTADPADLTNPFVALSGTTFGVDFNPVPDRLRVVSSTGQNLRINVDTGATTTDTNLTSGAPAAAAYTNNFAAACRTALFDIDPTTDRLLAQSPPNDGVTTAVGTGLGVDATAVGGFDVVTDLAATSTAYAVLEVGGTTGLYTIDLATGAATSIGALGLATGETVRGLALPTPIPASAIPQARGELLGISTTTLVSFERGAPTKLCTQVPLTGLAANDVPVGLDVRPSTGLLYLLANKAGAGTLYTVDPATGAATSPVAIAVPLVGTTFGVNFNPTGPVALRVVSDTGQNLRVTDVTTGATTTDGALNGAGTTANAASYTDSVPGAGTTALYVIDATADRLRLQSNPNAGTLADVGALGVDVAGAVGFEVDGRDNVAFVGVNTAASTATSLRTIDLATGTLSATLGNIGGGAPLVAITRPTPSTTVFAVTAANNLVTVSLADPSMVTTIGAVTGLAAGETIVGIDIRPSTGLLYAVGSLGHIYQLDTTTGAATLASTLTADPADLTAPFTALSGTQFGTDFNPTGPVALRVVSDTEQNLRIPDVTAGRVTTDTALARAARSYTPVGAAYAANSPGSTATVLYALDDSNDRLIALAPPNNGSVREIGPLGIDATGAAALEIIGDNTAIAVVAAGSTKTVVSIDLTTGAATTVGTLAIGGRVVGLAAAPVTGAPAANSTVFVVSSDGTLASFPRNAPASLTTIGSISGLGLAESIESFDIRPSTGQLYILVRTLLNAGRLYTVDATTGAATLVSSLTAEATDTTAPYNALALGVDYSIDFNPTGPVALRILGSDGSNLRIVDPTLGAVTTDTNLNVGAPDVGAAGYTNSFKAPAGVTLTTSLYVIDPTSASLLLVNPPNDGTLTPVGALSPSLTLVGATTLDIGAGNNGVVLATLQRTGETFSRLYRIALRTGLATEVGTGIGGAAGSAVNGLAIRIQ